MNSAASYDLTIVIQGGAVNVATDHLSA